MNTVGFKTVLLAKELWDSLTLVGFCINARLWQFFEPAGLGQGERVRHDAGQATVWARRAQAGEGGALPASSVDNSEATSTGGNMNKQERAFA